ncbi:MAG: hypothetical protein KGL74_03715 [Elusimicrobia bacterium]|nr:hypothetical protein [Elusimicrobiota bacterium]MDE2510208.1 hypothetical protein [Elusimicrobiota bacterium]
MMSKFVLWLPVCLLAAAAALWAGPWHRISPQDEVKARNTIVPLDARDPSSLVMAPSPVRCAGPCPTFEKPR